MKEIVANHQKNRLRALSRERERLADSQAFEREAPGVSARDAQPDALLADLEEQERTLQAMARLEEEAQDLVTMRLFERLSWSDIGTILGCGRHTARDRYERALERLTRIL
jgi:RNA polymerase sigma factor (sigma-70 family)